MKHNISILESEQFYDEYMKHNKTITLAKGLYDYDTEKILINKSGIKNKQDKGHTILHEIGHKIFGRDEAKAEEYAKKRVEYLQNNNPKWKYTTDTQKILKEKTGYRCDGEYHKPLSIGDIIDQETEELGNKQMIKEMQRFIGVKNTQELRTKYPEAKGIWLTSKEAATKLYCEGNKPEKYTIPECAKVISDLGYDGTLFLIPKGCEIEKKWQ